MIGGASGVIFAVVVIVWVAYVVPLMLRRYDEASTTSTLGSLSPLSRVISRPGRRAEAVADESATGRDVDVKTEDKAHRESVEPTTPARAVLDRPAARLAARRRRRVLITLLVTLVVVAGLGIGGVFAPVWIAIPAVLLVTWLVTCRIQVRGELGLSRRTARGPSTRSSSTSRTKSVAKRSDKNKTAPGARGASAADEEDTIVVSHQFEDIEPHRPRTMEQASLEIDALDDQLQIAVPSASTTGEALWDPLPITLPTYVTKPRVGRTVRTIDLAQPGVWSSGHVEAEGDELPGHDTAKASDADHGGPHQQAVGH